MHVTGEREIDSICPPHVSSFINWECAHILRVLEYYTYSTLLQVLNNFHNLQMHAKSGVYRVPVAGGCLEIILVAI